jgi:adenylyltransferase/sulfurtransferase
MTIRPGETACLACVTESGDNFPWPGSERGVQADGAEPTCDTLGVLGAAAGVIASIQAAAAVKLLVGKHEPGDDRLVTYDVWSRRFQSVDFPRQADCRACARRDLRYLTGEAQPHITLCGRDSVHIHERTRRLDLNLLGRRISAAGNEVRHNEFLMRFLVPPYEVTLFADGRAIIKGTRDVGVARALYARYIGA